jgi:Fe-S cluster assembly protein SufD
MSALLDSFAATFDALAARDAAGLGENRRSALDSVLRDGLPGPRSEAWKYTSLRALERRGFIAPPATSIVDAEALAARIAAIPSPRMVFVDGRLDAGSSVLDGLPDGIDVAPLSRVLHDGAPRDANILQRRYAGADQVFAVANAALAEEGAVIRVDRTTDTTLHLVFVATSGDIGVHLRHLIDLRNDASLSLVEHHLALGEDRGLANHVSHVHLGQRARLHHVRLQDAAAGASLFARTDAVLARDADYRRTDLELGSGLSRHELNVRLEGDHANLQADGVLLADGSTPRRYPPRHRAHRPRYHCTLGWRGIAGQRGRAVFHGGIVIRAGADGSEANLSNKNLLLSATAEIDTQPVLEIHADEVKAAHGATVGQLDANALFYLRSRGLGEAEARALLTGAFCREIVAGIDDAPTRSLCEDALDAALARLGA